MLAAQRKTFARVEFTGFDLDPDIATVTFGNMA
jgi:hypothetical protein